MKSAISSPLRIDILEKRPLPSTSFITKDPSTTNNKSEFLEYNVSLTIDNALIIAAGSVIGLGRLKRSR